MARSRRGALTLQDLQAALRAWIIRGNVRGMRPAWFAIALAVSCGHAPATRPADTGAIQAEDQVDRDDRNHDGTVDPDEATAALLERVDTDHDGRISAAEAKAASGDDATALGDFATHDTNADGFLTRDDVHAIFESHLAAGKTPPPEQGKPPHGRGRGKGRHAGARGGGFGGDGDGDDDPSSM